MFLRGYVNKNETELPLCQCGRKLHVRHHRYRHRDGLQRQYINFNGTGGLGLAFHPTLNDAAFINLPTRGTSPSRSNTIFITITTRSLQTLASHGHVRVAITTGLSSSGLKGRQDHSIFRGVNEHIQISATGRFFRFRFQNSSVWSTSGDIGRLFHTQCVFTYRVSQRG